MKVGSSKFQVGIIKVMIGVEKLKNLKIKL